MEAITSQAPGTGALSTVPQRAHGEKKRPLILSSTLFYGAQ